MPQKLDTTYQIETPEGVTLELKLAGPVVRSGAWLLDALIRIVIYLAISILLTAMGATGVGLILISIFLLEWFYPVIFELTWGATPGKRAQGLVVVHTNGTPIRWQASMIRNLLRAVDFLPLFYGFGLLSMLMSNRFQRLGDIAAGTLVIHKPEVHKTAELGETPAIPAPVTLTLDQRQAVISFAERAPQLADARVDELAEYMEPITGKRGKEATKTVLGYAQWLLKGH